MKEITLKKSALLAVAKFIVDRLAKVDTSGWYAREFRYCGRNWDYDRKLGGIFYYNHFQACDDKFINVLTVVEQYNQRGEIRRILVRGRNIKCNGYKPNGYFTLSIEFV